MTWSVVAAGNGVHREGAEGRRNIMKVELQRVNLTDDGGA
jgi:hypothetical protein